MEIPAEQKNRAHKSDWKGILVRDFINFKDFEKKFKDDKAQCNICGLVFTSRSINRVITVKHEKNKEVKLGSGEIYEKNLNKMRSYLK